MNLAREDYYLAGKEPPGFWLGEGASLLGLSGTVEGDDFRNLLGGFSADRSIRLVHNAGSLLRRSGWDMAWSVPKSVSVAWSQGTPEIRAVIENELRAAVRRGIRFLETVGVVSRSGTDGVVHECAKLIFAAFEHSTSRAQDPQLHIHTILINIGIRPDGSTGTLDPRALYRHQLAAGAIFRAELAARLERSLGLRARRAGRCFEIIGVATPLIDEFSKRRVQIEARLRELGVSSPAAAEKAALDTRPNKEVRSREELFPLWQQVGREHQWSTKELGWLLHAPAASRHVDQEKARAAESALRALTLNDSHFCARQVVQALAEEAQGRGLDADSVLALHARLLASPQVVQLQSLSNERQWTTPEMLALEKRVLHLAEVMHGRECLLRCAEPLIATVTRHHSHLSNEQRHALQHVTETAHGLRVVSGMAGTGKSTLFRAAQEVWARQGRQCIGACLAGKAALELTEAANIPAQTIQRTLQDLDGNRFSLDPKDVLLVDEAGMVGTRQMTALLEHCCRAHATLILCGDARQLQAIEAGGVFRELTHRFGASNLQEIKRQREPWAREAVKAFAEGRAAEALQPFVERGLVSLSDEPEEAIRQLLADWKREALARPSSNLILASRTADVQTINHWAQTERRRAGQLNGFSIDISGSPFYAGDRIVFGRNSPALSVANGQVATIERFTTGHVVARLDSGRCISFDPLTYPHVQLAYALTTHKAQGLTVERAFIHVDSSVESREAAYVQASRSRGVCSFYAVVDGMDNLEHCMSRSRPKVLATSLLKDEQQPPVLTLAQALS